MTQAAKTLGTPRPEWTTMKPLWARSRAILGGLESARAHDVLPGITGNLLVPFSSTMDLAQFNVLKSEAELPCITAQFSKIMVESLLRKRPKLDVKPLPQLNTWLLDSFGQDGLPVEAEIGHAAIEELTTGNCWVFVDHPSMTEEEFDVLTPEERKLVRPYTVIRQAEEIINWLYSQDKFGRQQLQFVVVHGYETTYAPGEVHPQVWDTVWVHKLNSEGHYIVEKHRGMELTETPTANGEITPASKQGGSSGWTLQSTAEIKVRGAPMEYIPAWPLSGSTVMTKPPLLPLVDKEVALYNKMTRRNHLLYNASTYTPYVSGDITDDQFDKIVRAGLGSWLQIPANTTIDALTPPSDALSDYDRAIAAAIEEMAKLGVRMLAAESAQSGVALDIRNAAQTAQIGALNAAISATWRQVIQCMVHWYTGERVELDQIEFALSTDYLAGAMDSNAMRLVTEWYENGHIPRSVFLYILRTNDFLPDGYSDDLGQKEIRESTNFKTKIEE